MTPTTGSERKYLRGLAHHLKPLAIVGENGITDNFIQATDEALEIHELIKVRFNSFKDEKKTLVKDIEKRTRSTMVGMIGHIAILYRQQPDKEKRKIPFPA